MSRKLANETLDIIKKSNAFTLEKLLKIYEITADIEIDGEINVLYNEMEKFYLGLNRKVEKLSDKMLRFQLVEQKFQNQGLVGYFQNSQILSKIFRI